MKKILSILSMMLISSIGYCATYYVDLDGDDTNCDGSTSDPYPGGGPGLACAFQTPQKCANTVTNGGDTCILDDGTYPVGFTFKGDLGRPNGSAASTKSITNISQANPPVVTVSGHGYSNGDYVYIEDCAGMIQFNYKMYKISNVTTDTFTLDDENSSSYEIYTGSGTVRKVSPIVFKAANRGGAIIDVSVEVSGWSNSGEPTNTYHSSAVGFGTTNSAARIWRVGDTTMLTHVSSSGAVDAEGEFFYDAGNDRFVIYTTADPTTKTYKAWDSLDAEDNPAIYISRVEWIYVDGIYTQYSQGGILVGTTTNTSCATNTQYVTVKFTNSTYSTGTGSNIVQTTPNCNTSHISFDHMTAALSDDTALTGSVQNNGHCFKCGSNFNGADGTYITISNSTLYNCRWHGIQMSNGYTNGFFYGNRIYNYGLKGTGNGAGIRIGRIDSGGAHTTKNAHIFDNDIGNGSGGTGSSIGSSIYLQEDAINVYIYRNKLHDNDWHGVYLFTSIAGLVPSNVQIYNNLIYNDAVSGVRVEQSQSVLIFNNTFYENGTNNSGSTYASLSLNDGTGSDRASGVVFKNNIVYNLTARTISGISGTSLTSDFNILYTEGSNFALYDGTNYTSFSSYQSASNQDGRSINSNPLLTNPTSDLTTTVSSPARSAGQNLTYLGYFTNDYLLVERNNIWDIGAYEQSSESTVEGIKIG